MLPPASKSECSRQKCLSEMFVRNVCQKCFAGYGINSKFAEQGFAMKLITEVEYFTEWGEEIFLRANGCLHRMDYHGVGKWHAVIDRLKPGQTLEYRYELHSGGLCRRTEWDPHIVTMPEGNSRKPVQVTDKWNDVPQGLPFRSAPFADGVFRTVPGRLWKAAGTAIPVFSLRSESGFGIGEFHDLKLLVDWAALTGQKIIQLLPVNDTTMTGTWEDSYPYNACSSFALHPQFIHLPDVGVAEDEAYTSLRDELNALPEVDYERVNREKQRLLREAFRTNGARTLRTRACRSFVEENRDWLLPYAMFCVLRDAFGTADFSRWKSPAGRKTGERTGIQGDFTDYDRVRAEAFAAGHKKEIDYHFYVQYHLHVQLSEARNYARGKGIVFKGDLPIGVSRTSADAWTGKKLFNMDSQAGAPPDAFSADGQNWGFPTYNWDEMARDGYAWWKSRLKHMSLYFDVFRIDHILGFFRIWEIPLSEKSGLMGHFNPALPYSEGELASLGFDVHAAGQDGNDVLFVEDPRRKGWWHPRIAAQFTSAYAGLDPGLRQSFDRLYDDFFYRRHNAFWKESAMRKLPPLLSATGMLACGEDLGMIPDCVSEVMGEYQILSLEIQRMPKSVHEVFADPAHYPYCSVCTTSTHDMNPIRAWWAEDRKVTDDFWHMVMHREGEAPADCGPWICREIVRLHLESSSMLVILPLQDWLSLDGDLRAQDPTKERINVPAIPRYYWKYRMHLTLETLIASDAFNSSLREMISDSGRCQ